MHKALQSQSTPIRFRRESGRPKSKFSAVADLAERFEQFRRMHPRGTRIPDDLRLSTLNALETGVSANEVHRSCGVSFSQMAAWKKRRGAGSAPSAASTRSRETAETNVRVFSVVDAPTFGCAEPLVDAGAMEQGFELRVGAWSVRVRLLEPRAKEGGRVCCP